MNRLVKKSRSQISKFLFGIGATPRIAKNKNYRDYIPSPYSAVITITADFELAWAWRYAKGFDHPLGLALAKAKQERANVPRIIELCEQYNIPITWATVGHLFLENCEKKHGLSHSELPRLSNFENDFWKFSGEDWFEHDPAANVVTSPEWYGPDLIDLITNSTVGHEIGCHTFSHIDCRNEVCPAEVFDAEIELCKSMAKSRNLQLRSFVHPGHTIGNLTNLQKHGFTSFQTDPGNILGVPVHHDNGLWELQRTYEFAYRPDWSVRYHIKRYKTIIDRAVKTNSVCNFWFHPSFDTSFCENILPSIFQHINTLRQEILVVSVGEYIDLLEERSNA